MRKYAKTVISVLQKVVSTANAAIAAHHDQAVAAQPGPNPEQADIVEAELANLGLGLG